jgi:hypothetical protein
MLKWMSLSWALATHACNPSYFEASPGKKRALILQTLNTHTHKRGW